MWILSKVIRSFDMKIVCHSFQFSLPPFFSCSRVNLSMKSLKLPFLVLFFNLVSSELLQYFSKVIQNCGKEFAIFTI